MEVFWSWDSLLYNSQKYKPTHGSGVLPIHSAPSKKTNPEAPFRSSGSLLHPSFPFTLRPSTSWSWCDGNGGNELVSPLSIACHPLALQIQRPLEGRWETVCIETTSSSSNLTPQMKKRGLFPHPAGPIPGECRSFAQSSIHRFKDDQVNC